MADEAPWLDYSTTPQAAGPWTDYAQPPVLEDIKKTIPGALSRGVVGTLAAPGTIADLLTSAGEWAGGKLGMDTGLGAKVHSAVAPYTYEALSKDAAQRLQQLQQNLPKPIDFNYIPQTTPGKYAGSIAEAIPGAMLPIGKAGIIGRLGTAVAGGAGAEAGREAAQAWAPDAEPYAGLAGGLAGAIFGPAGLRKAITSQPQSAQTAADVARLTAAGMPKSSLTAGAYTGSPFLRQFESNLGAEKFAEGDTSAFTKMIAQNAGLPAKEVLTDADFNQARAAYKPMLDAVKNAEIQPTNYQTLMQEIAGIQKGARSAISSDKGLAEIDDMAREIGGLNQATNVMSIRGVRYNELRQQLQKKINDDSITGVARDAYVQMRKALTDAMSRELPPEFADLNNKYANFQMLTKAPPVRGQYTPEMVKKAQVNQWGPESYVYGRGLGGVTQAAERVLYRPGVAKESPLTDVAGALGGMATSGLVRPQDTLVGGILGKELAKALAGVAKYGAKPAYLSPLVQGYLKNQAWQPSYASVLHPVTTAKLLAGPATGPWRPPQVIPPGAIQVTPTPSQ